MISSNKLCYFHFLKDSFRNFFCQILYVNLIFFFASIHCYLFYFFQKQRFHWFSVITQFALRTLFSTHCYILSTGCSWRWICSPIITRTHEEIKIRWSAEKYCLPIHPLKCVISKQYNIGRKILNLSQHFIADVLSTWILKVEYYINWQNFTTKLYYYFEVLVWSYSVKCVSFDDEMIFEYPES